MEVLNVKQLLEYKAPSESPIIGGGILYPGTRMFLYGRYKSLKSMLAIDLAFCIAHGIPWLDYKTKRSRVMVVQMEIPKAMFRKRIERYCRNGYAIPDNLYFINEPYLKLDRDVGLQKLEAALRAFNPDVLIIDPLYKVLSGNINDHQPVEIFQSNIDKLKEQFSLSIIIIAHPRQRLLSSTGLVLDMGADEFMGSSNWPNWADTIIKVTRDSDYSPFITLAFQVMRHWEPTGDEDEEMQPIRAKMTSFLHWRRLND